jgi:hypothetical protein
MRPCEAGRLSSASCVCDCTRCVTAAQCAVVEGAAKQLRVLSACVSAAGTLPEVMRVSHAPLCDSGAVYCSSAASTRASRASGVFIRVPFEASAGVVGREAAVSQLVMEDHGRQGLRVAVDDCLGRCRPLAGHWIRWDALGAAS